MNAAPISTARVSNQLQSTLLLSSLQGQQVDLLKVQMQISTQQRLSLGSDDPAAALGIIQLRRQLNDNSQTKTNLSYAQAYFESAYSALSSTSDLINQASSIASAMVSNTTSADERKAQAAVVDSLITRALSLANTRYSGAAVFGGSSSATDPYASVSGGYLFQGSTEQQSMLVGNGQSMAYTVDATSVYGGLSTQVQGCQDLTPALNTNTRLADMKGARGTGVDLGSLRFTVGATNVTVDLSSAVTAGDVVSKVQSALTAAGLSVTIARNGDHFAITNAGGTAVSVTEVGAGTTAADLGLPSVVAAGSTTQGNSVRPAVTATTLLSDLRGGLGIDASGLQITNGQLSKTISLSGMTQVQDLLNAINASGTQAKATINAAGTGIDVLNALSGSALQIGENGGATAQQLGIRSFQPATLLADLNAGAGITPISQSVSGPSGDIVITRTDGSSFTVTLSGIKSPTDIINAINNAADNTDPATKVTASLNSTGNGISLSDASSGTGNLSAQAGTNYVSNGSDLGFLTSGTGTTLTGGNMTLSTDDIRITRRDGSSFTVSFGTATTVQQVLDAINNAAGNTDPATKVTASLNSTGNGISLSDATMGSGTLSVTAVNASQAAGQLGILKTADTTTPGQISGDDVSGLMPEGLLSSLTMLRDALNANDTAGIQRAAALLSQDSKDLGQAEGQLGARMQDVEGRLNQTDTDKVSLNESLSLLADTDMTEAVTKYTALETVFEASLKAAQLTQNMSLLDFLS